MSDRTPTIDWSSLQHTSGPVPIDAIKKSIQLLTQHPLLLNEFIDRYKKITSEPYVVVTFEYAYLPYILTKSASNFPTTMQQKIGDWLIGAIHDACIYNDDYLSDFLLFCALKLGSPALLAAAEHMDDKIIFEPDCEQWHSMWEVADLVTESSDESMRLAFAQRATNTLQACIDGKCEIISAGPAAWLAASLQHAAARPLIEKILQLTEEDNVTNKIGKNEFKHALKLYEGETPPPINRRDLLEEMSKLKESLETWYEKRPADWNPFDDLDEGFDEADASELDSLFLDEPEEENLPILQSPIHYDSPKIGRNDPCPCGSGKKYKKCCGS